jgi:hypothetical protein
MVASAVMSFLTIPSISEWYISKTSYTLCFIPLVHDCGIIVNQNTDGSTQAGIEQCQKNPASCRIALDQPVNFDSLIEEGKTQCRANPTACGIHSSCATPARSYVSLTNGTLFIPAVDVPDPFGKSVTYEVGMKLLPGVEPLSFSVTSAAAIPK